MNRTLKRDVLHGWIMLKKKKRRFLIKDCPNYNS